MLKWLTVEEIKAMIFKTNGTAIMTLVVETSMDSSMYKKDNPYIGRTTKESKVNVILQSSYANAMTKAYRKYGILSETETFIPQQRTWGERVDNSAIIEHKGNFYLECRILNPLGTTYKVDGVEADKEEFKAYMKPYNNYDSLVYVRTYKLSSIKEIHYNQNVYKVA